MEVMEDMDTIEKSFYLRDELLSVLSVATLLEALEAYEGCDELSRAYESIATDYDLL